MDSSYSGETETAVEEADLTHGGFRKNKWLK
jgi:hypothetical protein